MARERGRRSSKEKRGGRRGGWAPSRESVESRGNQSGSDRAQFLPEDIQTFTPAVGDNFVRIVYPTWEGANHWGYDVFMHYGVGPDNEAFVCPSKHGGNPCPVCEERERALDAGDEDYAKSLRPNKRVFVWIIDRENEKKGPFIWSMPWTIDRDISKLCADKRTGEILNIVDAEDGYDVEFERKGQGERTEYLGISIARSPSEVDNDDALDIVEAKPIPDLLIVHEYDRIAKSFRSRPSGGDDNRAGRVDGNRKRKEEPEKGGRDIDLPDPEEIAEADMEELEEMIDEFELDIDDDIEDEDELREAIMDALGIEPEEEEPEEEPEPPRRRRRRSEPEPEEEEPEEDEDEDPPPRKRRKRASSDGDDVKDKVSAMRRRRARK